MSLRFSLIPILISFHLLILLLLAGCREKSDPIFDRLEERVSDKPDSVLTVLENMDTTEFHSDADKSRHALLLMMAQAKCRVPLSSDSAIYRAADYFHRENDILNEAKSHYYAGLAQRRKGNYQAAIYEALHAIDRAHEAADTFWMGRAHDLAYEVYIATYDCRNAAIEADKAAVFFKKAGAQPFHRYALLEKAQALNYPVHGNGIPVGEGMALLDSLKRVALHDNDSALAAECLYYQTFHYYESKDFIKVQSLLDSLSLLPQPTYLAKWLLPIRISTNIYKGDPTSRLMEEYDRMLSSRQDSITYIQKLREIAVSKGNWKEAYLYADSLLSYYATIIGEHTFESLGKIAADYQQQLLNAKQEENKSQRLTGILISVIAILAVFMLIYIILLIRRRNKQKEANIMGQLAVIAAENEDLKCQIYKEKDLMEENAALNLKMQRTQEMLASERYQLSMQRSALLGNRIDTLCDLAMRYYGKEGSTATKQRIYHRVLNEVEELKSEAFLRELVERINEIHDDILTRLEQQLPSVVKGNLRWIALMIGGIRPQTISFLLDMKIQTFYSKRLRLRDHIEKSEAPDKEEFLKFFPDPK